MTPVLSSARVYTKHRLPEIAVRQHRKCTALRGKTLGNAPLENALRSARASRQL